MVNVFKDQICLIKPKAGSLKKSGYSTLGKPEVSSDGVNAITFKCAISDVKH